MVEDVADKFGGVGLLEFLEVEDEIVMLVAIYADLAAFFLVNDAVEIDLGDRFCPSFDGAVKGNDDLVNLSEAIFQAWREEHFEFIRSNFK